MFAGASVIAVFGIAVNLEAYTFTFAYALNGLFLPRISRILKDNGEILPLMIRVGRFQILLLGLVIIGFIIVGKDFIYSWLGEGYEDAYVCTILFIIPSFVLLPADIADQTLIASGNVKYRAFVYVVMAIVNVLLSYFMTKSWGCIGLAFSIFIAYMIRTIALYYVYYAKLKIDIFRFFKESFCKMSIGLIVSALLSWWICKQIDLTGWINVIVKILIVIASYCVVTMKFSINESEKQILKGLIKKYE